MLVNHEFDEALRGAHGPRFPVGAERELAHAIGAAAGLHLLLRESHRGEFGPRVHNARDGAVMHVHRLAGNHFGGNHPFFFSLVREQFATAHVTDGIHTRQVGLLLIVYQNFAARAHREAKRRRVDAADGRLPTH